MSKKGQTFMEFVLIIALFGVVVGMAIFAMSPTMLKDYFKASTPVQDSNDATGVYTLKKIGE